MISKENFLSVMSSLKSQRKRDERFSKCMEEVFDTGGICPNNDDLYDTIVLLLSLDTGFDTETLYWFIFECDFGNAKHSYISIDGVKHHLNSPSDFYDFILFFNETKK